MTKLVSNYYLVLERYKAFDQAVLAGWKTYIVIGVLFASYYFLPDSKVMGFTTALGLAHLFLKRQSK